MEDEKFILNRKAKHLYEMLEDYSAGMVLIGSEIKSLRSGKASIEEAYCLMISNEVFIRNMYIAPYEKNTLAKADYNPRRDRKLLLNKEEIKRIKNKMIDKGLTIVPRWLSVKKKAKLGISIGKGKKTRDKRQDIKKRDAEMEMKRALKK